MSSVGFVAKAHVHFLMIVVKRFIRLGAWKNMHNLGRAVPKKSWCHFPSCFRPSTTSAQTRMSTSDLRGVGISAPTGFVHVSGYNRTFQRCGSVSEASCSSAIASGDKIKNELQLLMSSQQHQKHRDHSRSRMRELSNIDPKFTSQVRTTWLANIIVLHMRLCSRLMAKDLMCTV